jgi:hypothetical protein
MKRLLVWIALLIAFAGCHGSTLSDAFPREDSVLREAKETFTYKGKPIAPFFLTDFCGGEDAPDLWTREMGGRITSIAVEGLSCEGDGSYAGTPFETGELVTFDLPADHAPVTGNPGWFGYRFIGTTTSGISVLEYKGNTGGSGTVIGVLFVRFEMASIGVTAGHKRDQLTMRFLGERSWGDRVYRDIRLEGNVLRLGPMQTTIPAYEEGLAPAEDVVLE